MARSSHQKCKVCQTLIHKRNRYGLCHVHYQQHEDRLRLERATAKLRRERQQSNPITQIIDDLRTERREEQIMQEMSTNGTVALPDLQLMRQTPRKLSDEQKLEIGAAYEDERVAVLDILTRFEITENRLYDVLKGLGLPTRSQKRKTAAAAPVIESNVGVPPEVEVALEHMLRPVEPMAPTPLPRARQAPVAWQQAQLWEATVTGTVEFRGEELEDIISQVKAVFPNLRITAIKQVTG
jgi:transposase-like protein